jgi:hypothetical protein
MMREDYFNKRGICDYRAVVSDPMCSTIAISSSVEMKTKSVTAVRSEEDIAGNVCYETYQDVTFLTKN